MAVIVYSSNPEGLLKRIEKDIRDGTIRTWAIQKHGITHLADQWAERGWFVPSITKDALRFELNLLKNEEMVNYVLGVYHGRLIQMIMAHYYSGEFVSIIGNLNQGKAI